MNVVWNYVNELHKKSWTNYKRGSKSKFFSAFDVNNLLSGSSKELGLQSQTVQNIGETYVSSRNTAKKSSLSWRSRKRHLGWVPFKVDGIKYFGDHVTYLKKSYKIYVDRKIPEGAKIKCGSFNQDSRDRWFVNITFEVDRSEVKHTSSSSSIGIDLGVSSVLTLSDGTSIPRLGFTKKFEDRLAHAQRARKKKLTAKIHDKIKNSRKDFLHKTSVRIAKQFATIIVGDVKSQKIIDISSKSMKKGVYDASWFSLKSLLEYKALKLGGKYLAVNEAYTTQDCSLCKARCGPKGREGLCIREWVCVKCGAKHHRDVNAAKNILRIGHDTLSLGIKPKRGKR